VSPWMTAFYICAILFAPMLFMGMLPSAQAEGTQEPIKDNSVSGPGEYEEGEEVQDLLTDILQLSASISERPIHAWGL